MKKIKKITIALMASMILFSTIGAYASVTNVSLRREGANGLFASVGAPQSATLRLAVDIRNTATGALQAGGTDRTVNGTTGIQWWSPSTAFPTNRTAFSTHANHTTGAFEFRSVSR